MQDTMAASQERGFTIMTIKQLLLTGILCFLLGSGSCNKRSKAETIPTGPVSLTIDLNLPSNSHLNNVGTYGYYGGGVNGVIVVHDFDDQWYAFERTCAWQPLNSCSEIWGDSINLNLRCGTFSGKTFTACCSSTFTYGGWPSGGPANGRLAQYHISRSSNLLLVTN